MKRWQPTDGPPRRSFDDDEPVLRVVPNTPAAPAPADVVDEEAGEALPAPPASAPPGRRCVFCGGLLIFANVAVPLRCANCGQEPKAPERPKDWGA